MSGPGPQARLDELLQDRALGVLSPAESAEMELILQELGFAPEDVPADWDLLASELTVAMLPPAAEQPPARVMRRVEADALAWFAFDRDLPLRRVADSLAAPPTRLRPRLGLLLAAAAMLLAWLLWSDRPASPSAQREHLLSSSASLVSLRWQPGPSELAGRPAGDVVWSGERQEGYLRLRGLPRNDPAERRYQLWIFDAGRDAARPVDGGLFDITDEARLACIPIHAKLPVAAAQAFAITVELPAGAVVSDRQHIVATAGL